MRKIGKNRIFIGHEKKPKLHILAAQSRWSWQSSIKMAETLQEFIDFSEATSVWHSNARPMPTTGRIFWIPKILVILNYNSAEYSGWDARLGGEMAVSVRRKSNPELWIKWKCAVCHRHSVRIHETATLQSVCSNSLTMCATACRTTNSIYYTYKNSKRKINKTFSHWFASTWTRWHMNLWTCLHEVGYSHFLDREYGISEVICCWETEKICVSNCHSLKSYIYLEGTQ